MSFREFSSEADAIQLLQRSLDRGRLGHAYLFNGADLGELEGVARTLAKTVMCEQPPNRGRAGLSLDSCDSCMTCRRIDRENHPDVIWIRPESKLRVIKIEQVRELLQTIYLKPTQASHKVAILVGADRLNVQAANAFLKTLEEPPADSILILLSTDPQRLLETILSRCLRLNFSGETTRHREPAFVEWLAKFGDLAGADERSLLSRYRLLSLLLAKLSDLKGATEKALSERSPLEKFDDVDPRLREKWEDELTASIEAEYRRQRAELLAGLQWWLRDVWLHASRLGTEFLSYPELASSARRIAARVSAQDAMENVRLIDQVQRLLGSNVQEALALEVGLLKLKL